MSEPKLVELQPQAGIFLESIRNVGYSFETALADIVDNSLSAEAKNVNIIGSYFGDEDSPALCVQDDGWGMAGDDLIQAMQFAHRDILLQRAPNDLGRFGLGMKLASLSQARCLLVVSKTENRLPTGAIWDIDYVRASAKWSLQVFRDETGVADLRALLTQYQFDDVFDAWLSDGISGTLVFWLRMDRFPSKDLDTRLVAVRGHLGLVFHRFLQHGISIKINSTAIKPTDPYLMYHPFSTSPQPLAFPGLRVSAHVLPYITALEEYDWDRMGITANRKSNVLKSGFYIYRANRLIVWGRWFGMVPGCPSKKIVRVELDIGTDTDDEWHLDVRKSKAEIPDRYRDFIMSSIMQSLDCSQRTFVYVARGETSQGVNPVWSIAENKEKGYWALQINKQSNLYAHVNAQLDEAGKKALARLAAALEKEFPYEAVYARYQLQDLDGGHHAKQ